MIRARPPLILALSVLFLSGCTGEQPPAPASSTAPSSTRGAGSEPVPDAPETAAPDAGATRPSTGPATKAEAALSPAPAVVLRDTEIKDGPYVDAKTLARLPAKTNVVVVDRRGGWLEVVRDRQRGWVRLLHVSLQPQAEGSTREELESIAKMATGRAGSGNIVNTTGIRGLDEAQLRKAAANEAELRRLESFGATTESAAQYARRHKLERRRLGDLAPR